MKNQIQFLPSSERTSFESYVEGQVQTAVAIAENEGSVFPTPEKCKDKNYDGVKFSKKYTDLIILIFVTWYSDFFKGFEGYVRYEIGLYLYQNRLFPELAASLVSKNILFEVIGTFSRFETTNALLGIMNSRNIVRVLSRVSLKFVHQRRPVYPQFRRGYRDHGSLRRPTTWLPTSDVTFDEEQRKKEKLDQDYQDLVSAIVRVSGDRIIKIYAKTKGEIQYESSGKSKHSN